VDVTLDTLKQNLGADWWVDGVPEEVRKICATRQEEERNKLPKECYLDLIDLKKIMFKNWRFFDPIFCEAGTGKQGKEKNLEFMDEQNRLRRLVAHPLKAHLSEYEFSASEIEFIKTTDALAMKMASIVRAKTSD
jgi:hypothetical protein